MSGGSLFQVLVCIGRFVMYMKIGMFSVVSVKCSLRFVNIP